jgi:hypothetical protein
MNNAHADAEGAKLKSMVVGGVTSSDVLINASFDVATATPSCFKKQRGMAAASSTGTGTFLRGQFVRQNYATDPTSDGEINPFR